MKNRVCVVCQKPFEVRRKLRWGNKTCGRECGQILTRRRIEKTCPQCQKPFSVPRSRIQKHCSRACWQIANPEVKKYKCDGCGIEFDRSSGQAKRSGKRRNFCAKECMYKFSRGPQHPTWRGNRRQDRGPDWKEQSAQARDRDEHKCQICGTPERKGQKLDVDHIVPYRVVLRNDMINLISTCKAPCHVIKTSTAEAMFLRGDYLGFEQRLKQLGWPMERVREAVRWWGNL